MALPQLRRKEEKPELDSPLLDPLALTQAPSPLSSALTQIQGVLFRAKGLCRGQTDGQDLTRGQLIFILLFYLFLGLQKGMLEALGRCTMGQGRPRGWCLPPLPHPRQYDLPCFSLSLGQAERTGWLHFLSTLGCLDR